MADPFFSQDDAHEGSLTPSEKRRLRFRNIPLRIVLPNLVTLLALSMATMGRAEAGI